LRHLGPGLAGGLANLHNAHKARTPIVNIVGEHPLSHKRHDAPLTADIEAIAKIYARWVRVAVSTPDLAEDCAAAILAARTAPGGIATLIVPNDVAWNESASVATVPPTPAPPTPAAATVEYVAAMLRSGLKTGILLSGNALYGKGLEAAGRVAAGMGASLLAPTAMTRAERGEGRVIFNRIPYVMEAGRAALKDFQQLILVGAPEPVTYFAYPGRDSVLKPQSCLCYALARPGEDYVAALEALIDALGLRLTPPLRQERQRIQAPSGEITIDGLAAAVAAHLPENVIVIDESMTSGRTMMAVARGVAPHDWLTNTGGSIGIAMPMAVGAAVASPDRRVLCLSADGSGMYTLQALWTMARESLNICTVVFANRAYAILKNEFGNIGAGVPGQRARDLLELSRPDLDWVSLARGMGVPAVRATTLEGFGSALANGFAAEGPSLIEVVL
jgi:acetolactate synthase-1/2/3 large subunit